MSTAAMAAMVTGPRRQYEDRYRNCQVSSIRCGSFPISSCATCSFRYAATASSRPFSVASPIPVTPSSVVIRSVTKLRDGLVTNTSAAIIFTAVQAFGVSGMGGPGRVGVLALRAAVRGGAQQRKFRGAGQALAVTRGADGEGA